MDFSFISDAEFRNSLVADYNELITCRNAAAWKSVQVIAGSIVEALLIEYLVVSGGRPNGKDPLALSLGEAVAACQTAGVIQRSTASLCDVVRDYRNLIHPGRMIRLSQEVTPESANIAVNLVALIRKEVAEKRKNTYGPTAEQLLRKLQNDEHSLSVVPQLLTETNAHERFRLADDLIPRAYFGTRIDPFAPEDDLPRLRSAYRQTLETLTDSEKGKLAGKYAVLIREDSNDKIEAFGEAFFLSSDIAYLRPSDALIVVKYLMSRLERPNLVISEAVIRNTRELGRFLPPSDIPKLADSIARLVIKQSDPNALLLAELVFDSLESDEKKSEMEKRAQVWLETAKKKSYPARVQERLSQLDFKWTNFPF